MNVAQTNGIEKNTDSVGLRHIHSILNEVIL